MKKSLLATTLSVVLFSAAAQAGDMTLYVSAKAVYSWERVKLKDSEGSSGETFKTPGVNLAVGMVAHGEKAGGMRAELEYGYRRLKSNSYVDEDGWGRDKTGIKTYMINGYYDIATNSPVKPYVGAGIGLADVSVKVETEDAMLSVSKTKFAYNLNAGVGYEISSNMTLDLGYRFLQASSFKKSFAGESLKFKTHANEVSLGLRYNF